jgi:hypothetical protein
MATNDIVVQRDGSFHTVPAGGAGKVGWPPEVDAVRRKKVQSPVVLVKDVKGLNPHGQTSPTESLMPF